jgi:hypothetical protein
MNFRGENEEPAAGRGKRLLRCDFGEGLQAMLEAIGAIGLDELSGRRSTLAYWEKVRVSLEKSYPERKIPTTETLRKHYQTAETVRRTMCRFASLRICLFLREHGWCPIPSNLYFMLLARDGVSSCCGRCGASNNARR